MYHQPHEQILCRHLCRCIFFAAAHVTLKTLTRHRTSGPGCLSKALIEVKPQAVEMVESQFRYFRLLSVRNPCFLRVTALGSHACCLFAGAEQGE